MERSASQPWQSPFCDWLAVAVIVMAAMLAPVQVWSQQFSIEHKSDSLSVLKLQCGNHIATWELPYPVFRFETADVNGDGSVDAVVGVYKSSRFFPNPSRRVFIFKNFDGDIRPLWLSSRLGGELYDFTVVDGNIRAIEVMTCGGDYVINDYAWQGFGMGHVKQVAAFNNLDQCYNFLNILPL